MKRKLARILIPIAMLLMGAWFSAGLGKRVATAEQRVPEKEPTAVDVLRLRAGPHTVRLTASGVVRPAQEVRLAPRVAGKISHVSSSLIPGGRVRRGQVLARIDARDYQLRVTVERGAVRTAQLNLETERARQRLARHEWKAMQGKGTPEPLFSRASQIEAADAALASQIGRLELAELDLERTVLRAPFDATVISESIDVGQFVGVGTEFAHLVGTRRMRVMVSLRLEELRFLRIPTRQSSEGSAVTVRQRLSRGESVVRQGRVVRLVDALDEESRRARLLVEVEGALKPEQGLPLLPGAHVSVELQGARLENVFAVPRAAVHEGEVVWLVRDGSLVRREIASLWEDQDNLYVTGGLRTGEQLVLTRLATPFEGLPVQAIAPAAPRADPEQDSLAPPKSERALRASAQLN